ncbi:Hypothetical protein, putative, partial [Bodo saltans]
YESRTAPLFVLNLTILFIDVMWSTVVKDAHRVHDGTNTGDTVLLSLRECTVEGLNVTMLRTNLSIVNNITMSPTSIANNLSENFMKVVLLEVYTDENTERGNAANVSFTLLTSSMGAVKLSSMPKAPDCSICTLTPGLFLGSLLRNRHLVHRMDSLSKVLQPAFDLLWAHGIGMTSQVTDVKLSVQSVFTMQLSMCADNYGAQVTMFGGLLYCQANNISGINIALKHAQLVALPQSEEAFNTTIGIEMNVGAVVFIPDISPVASVAHLNLHVERFDVNDCDHVCCLRRHWKFSSVTAATVAIKYGTMSLTAHGRSFNDAQAACRSASVVLLFSAILLNVTVSVDSVNLTAEIAVGFPSPAAALNVSSVGLFTRAAVMMTGSARSTAFVVDNTNVEVTMVHGYLNCTFSDDQSFVADINAALVALYPLTGSSGSFNSSTVAIGSSGAALTRVNFTATAQSMFIAIISMSTCAFTASVTILSSALTFSDIHLRSDARNFTSISPRITFVEFHVNKTSVFNTTVFMKAMTVGSVLNGRGNLTKHGSQRYVRNAWDGYCDAKPFHCRRAFASRLVAREWSLRSSRVSTSTLAPYFANHSLLTSIVNSKLEIGCDVKFNVSSPLSNSQTPLLKDLSVAGTPCISATLDPTETPIPTQTVVLSHATQTLFDISMSMSTHSFVISASQTLLVPLPGEAVVIQVARPVLGIASAAAAAVFLASGGAAVTAAADMQALLTLGMSNCAPSVLKKSSDVSLFLLSPFYALGLRRWPWVTLAYLWCCGGHRAARVGWSARTPV